MWLALIGATILIAIVVWAGLATQARAWLGYTFRGVPRDGGTALWIFAHNLRALLGVIGLLLVAQVAARATQSLNGMRALRRIGELVLVGLVAANVLVVGAAVGAYGARMVRALLPHGPIELAGFALAIALYRQGRDRPLPARQMILTASASVLLLGGAAALETFVTL